MSIKTKRIILYSLYGVITLTFLLSLLFVKTFMDDTEPEVLDVNFKPIVSMDDNTMSVFEEKDVISKPFYDDTIKIGVNYYDAFNSNTDSIIFYENTYMPSTGIFYQNETEYKVISIYDGKVEEITKDDLLGNIIKVSYGNNLIGMYECVDNINVNVGDSVNTSSILGTSSTCNLFKEKGNGFYFELIYNGKNINPEYYYGKRVDEI